MTDSRDDFSPIGEHGALEAEKKCFMRRARWRPIAAKPGTAIVFRTESGDYMEMPPDSTAGERLFTRPASWVAVDVARHTFTYNIAFKDPTGSRGFVTSVSVESQVIDATAAVKDGADSVKEYLVPALETIVAGIGEHVTPAATEGAPILVGDALAQAQARLPRIVNEKIGGLPTWLSAQIRSAQVDLDAATKAHHARIVEEQHGGEVAAVETAIRRHQNVQQHADELADRIRRREIAALDYKDRDLADELEHHRQLRVLRWTAELAALERESRHIASTAAYEQDILELERAGKRAMLESTNSLADATQKLKLQELWRTALAPMLTSRSGRRIEPFIMDPTAENLQRVVDELEAADQRGWHDILMLLQQMVDKGLVDVDDPVYHTIRELVAKLPGYPAMLTEPPTAKAIGDPTEAAIEGHAVAEGESGAESETGDADAGENDQRVSPGDGEPGDTTW